MGSLFGDIRLAIRRLRRSPGFTISALLILILSIGANSTIFTVVNRYLLQPLPVERPNDLVTLNYRSGPVESPSLSYPDYRDIRDRNQTLEGLATFLLTPVSTSYSGNNRRSWAYLVSGNYFELLGVQAFKGRALTSADDERPGANPVVMLSYGFWQGHFGGDPAVVGATMKLNGGDYTVIGVMPQGFYGTERIFTPDVFAPISMLPSLAQGPSFLEIRRVRNLFVFGRLKPGVTSAGAQAELAGIAAQLGREYPEDQGMEVLLSPVGLFGSGARGPFLAASVLLLVLAGSVLLVACANVAGLLLARSAGRRRETAIRVAVGATRGTLIREVMVESLLLNALAGVGGLVLAFWLRDLISGWAPPVPVPIIPDLEIDGRVLGLSVLASLAAGVLCGIAPGLQSARSSVAEALKQNRGGRFGRWSMQDLLVGAQVALSMVLLIGSLLVASSLGHILDINFGFDPDQGASLAVNLSMEGYSPDRTKSFRRDLLERTRALPGVESAALAGLLPLGLEQSRSRVAVEGQPEAPVSQALTAGVYFAGEGYFRTMRTRLVAGREFEDRDETANVVIVNQTFARNFLAGKDPLGARIRIDASPQWMEVVGVVEDGKYVWINESPLSVVYLPISASSGLTTIVARGAMDTGVLVRQMRSTVLGLDPALSIFYDGPLTRRVDLQLLPSRFLAASLGSFGLVSMLLVGAGLYGILSYSVTQRTREIGIRMALGAAPGSVIRTMVARVAMIAGMGIAIGVAGGLALGKLFAQALYGINPYDPVTICAAVAVMALVGLIACWLPVLQATRVDPLTALRSE
jgi:predicted permease